MKNEDSASSENPTKSSNNSQNVINNTANIHMKTENERSEEDHHRSPEINRTQFRDTLRKQHPRMANNNKLPDVFKQHKKSRKVSSDVMNKIGTMIKNSESNQAQKLLKPLNLKEEDRAKPKDTPDPLYPVKKMMKIFTKLNEDVNSIEKMTINHLKMNQNLNQCITLEVIKRGHTTGTIKKMLHVPTLTLMCVREEPITEKQSRNFIRDWTEIWSKKLSGECKSFVMIHDVKFNFPEGAISIFMQYFRSRSLLNLLDITATLPESVIRQIFSQLLQILKTFYKNTNMHFGGLSPSQIMFSDDSKVKLSLGLFYHIPNLKEDSIYHIKGVKKNNKIDFNNTHSKFVKTTLDKSVNLDIERSVDIFKIGLVMLNCAIGNFQNFEQSSYLFTVVQELFLDQGQRQIQRDNVCCIIHSEQYLLQLNDSHSDTDRTLRKNDTDRFISYLKLLKDRFSIHFLNFLCQTLKLSHARRATLSELIESPFIQSPHDHDNRTVKISLGDLLAIGRGWNQEQLQSGIHQKVQSFLGKLRIVLENSSQQVIGQLLNNHRDRIYSLGKEVGLNSQVFGKKLEQLLSDLLHSTK